MGFENLSPEQALEVFRDPEVTVKSAVRWKKRPAEMPPGTRRGLSKSVTIAQATRGILGSAVDPATGNVVPLHCLQQRRVAESLKEERDES